MTDTQPLQFQPAATPANSVKNLARADLYGLLATLFSHTADVGLLQCIAATPLDPISDGDIAAADAQTAANDALTQTWRELTARAGQTTTEQADNEYTELFIGIGRSEVFLYGSYYQAGFVNEKPLVVLRNDLRRHGPERAEGIMETEDHLAILCEIMRYLIAEDGVAVARIGKQRAFFQRHLAPWVDTACDAVSQHPRTVLYADVVGSAKAFFDVERLALKLA